MVIVNFPKCQGECVLFFKSHSISLHLSQFLLLLFSFTLSFNSDIKGDFCNFCSQRKMRQSRTILFFFLLLCNTLFFPVFAIVTFSSIECTFIFTKTDFSSCCQRRFAVQTFIMFANFFLFIRGGHSISNTFSLSHIVLRQKNATKNKRIRKNGKKFFHMLCAQTNESIEKERERKK